MKEKSRYVISSETEKQVIIAEEVKSFVKIKVKKPIFQIKTDFSKLGHEDRFILK